MALEVIASSLYNSIAEVKTHVSTQNNTTAVLIEAIIVQVNLFESRIWIPTYNVNSNNDVVVNDSNY